MQRKTIFCDIDGTLIIHFPPSETSKPSFNPELLDGTLTKLLEWEKLGYTLILVTARKESMRSVTEQQLSTLGIFYDQLVMGLTAGPRYLINDDKPDGTKTCYSINLKRNQGIHNVTLQ